jgi:hypothetical protein
MAQDRFGLLFLVGALVLASLFTTVAVGTLW